MYFRHNFHIMRPVAQNQRRRYVSSNSPGGGTGAKSNIYDCAVYFAVPSGRPSYAGCQSAFGRTL